MKNNTAYQFAAGIIKGHLYVAYWLLIAFLFIGSALTFPPIGFPLMFVLFL